MFRWISGLLQDSSKVKLLFMVLIWFSSVFFKTWRDVPWLVIYCSQYRYKCMDINQSWLINRRYFKFPASAFASNCFATHLFDLEKPWKQLWKLLKDDKMPLKKPWNLWRTTLTWNFQPWTLYIVSLIVQLGSVFQRIFWYWFRLFVVDLSTVTKNPVLILILHKIGW